MKTLKIITFIIILMLLYITTMFIFINIIIMETYASNYIFNIIGKCGILIWVVINARKIIKQLTKLFNYEKYTTWL